MKKLGNNFMVLADQAVFSGGSFVTTILLAKIIGAENFGYFSSITLINYSIVSILNAVIINPMQVSLERIEDKKSYLSFNLFSQLLLVFCASLLIYSAFYMDFSFLKNNVQIDATIVLYFIGFVMHDYFRKLFLAQSNVKSALLIDVLSMIGTFLVIGKMWFAKNTTVHDAIFYISLSYLPSVIVGLFITKPSFEKFHIYKAYFKMHVSQGKWLLITTITQWWASNLFIVTSGVFLGIKTIGAFRLVQSLFGVLNLVLQTFENYALPEASRLFIISAESAKAYLRNISSKSAIVFGSVLLMLFIFSDQVILVAGGQEFLPYSFIIKGMCVLYAFIFLGYPVRMAIRMLLLNRTFFVGYLLSFVFSLLSFKFLLSHWNVSGAIVGLIISQIISLCYWQFVLYKKKFILWK
jgi:O-antigen/teichoic acid export membrane protein